MRRERPVKLSALAAGLGSVLWLLGAGLVSATPAWWTNVIAPAALTNDFAAVNAGQAKWFALQAHAHLEATLSGGAGFAPDTTPTNNYAVINLGQLKHLAKPHYDRLIAASHTNAYPWTSAPEDDHDYAVANIGQLKTVFNFEVTPSGEEDTDGDGLPDWVETNTGIFVSPTDTGTDPALADTDGDGTPDGEEVANRTDPNNPDTEPPTLVLTIVPSGILGVLP